MTHYSRILLHVLGAAWALEPEALARLSAILAPRIAGQRIPDEEIEARLEAAAAERAATRPASGVRSGSIAVLPIVGLMLSRSEALERTSGAVSTQRLTEQFRALVANPAVDGIVLDMDSPGGDAGGVAEFADAVFAARPQKPVVALANPLMASAAYWVGSAGSELMAAPSALVGSIGVYAAHEDISKALEAEGITMSLISAGKDKVLGNPFQALSEDGRAMIQERVDGFYDLFVRAVARGRGVAQKTVREGFGQGRVVMAAEAMKLGMADTMGTLEDAVVLAAKRAGVRMPGRLETMAGEPGEAIQAGGDLPPVRSSEPDADLDARQRWHMGEEIRR